MDCEDFLAKEQKVLELYFSSLGHFNYDKAKETVEKERDALCKTGANYLFSSVLTALSQMAVAEKLYMSLQYLAPKSFLRKDTSLKSLYEALRLEFLRLKDQASCSTPISCSPSPSSCSPMMTPSPSAMSLSSMSPTVVIGSFQSGTSYMSQSPQAPVLDAFLSHLCGQLHSFVVARARSVDFYDKLYSLSLGKMMKFKDLSAALSDIIQQNQKLFHHPILTPLKSSFSMELEALHHLLEAQVLLSQWQFLQALLHLKEAHARLGEWNASLLLPENRRTASSLLRADRLPQLVTWINKLNAFMVGKFTLYFYKILSRQTTQQEMKTFGSKMTIDYCQRIASLCKKSDALCVQLLFEALGVEGYYEHGYCHPDHAVEAPKGIDSYPVIYSYPTIYQDKQHRPNIIMIITKKSDDLNSEGIVYFYDSRMEKSYFLIKLDPRVTMVAIYVSRKSERDTYIVSCMQDLAAHVRGNKIFGMLKPGNK